MEKLTSKGNITLRISVTNKCNFKCEYCPPNMELFTPYPTSPNLPTQDMIEIIKDIVALGITRVSLTGGEPLTRPDIGLFCKLMKEEAGVKRIEMTTNGYLLDRFLAQDESKYVDFYKISFDSTSREKFNSIIGLNGYDKVVENIALVANKKLSAVLNVVISKANINELDSLITFAESLPIDLSLLDLVCHEETKEWWEENFYDFSHLNALCMQRYHPVTGKSFSPDVQKRLDQTYVHDREVESIEEFSEFGIPCPYYDTGKIFIRLKDSKFATRRDNLCEKCNEYCQEGPCSIRLAHNGWMTDCQSILPRNGFWVNKSQNNEERKEKIIFLHDRFLNSFKDTNSFEKFCKKHNVSPKL